MQPPAHRPDPRLPFDLPGVSRKGKVGNGNYVWISYFHGYLNEAGDARRGHPARAAFRSGRRPDAELTTP